MLKTEMCLHDIATESIKWNERLKMCLNSRRSYIYPLRHILLVKVDKYEES